MDADFPRVVFPQPSVVPAPRSGPDRPFVPGCADGVWCVEFGDGIPVRLPVGEQVGRMLRDGRVSAANDAAGALHGTARGGDMRGRDLCSVLGADGLEAAAVLTAFVAQNYQATDPRSAASLTGMVEQGRLTRIWGIESRLPLRAGVEGRLRQIQMLAAVGQVADGVAHDFNNLLTAIMGYGELVRDALGPSHPCLPDIEQVLSAGRRAEALARQLLSFSRGQRRGTEVIDVEQVLRELAPLLRRLVGDDIQMQIAVAPAPACVQGDRGQLELVIMNLALNAREAMPGGGALRIDAGIAEGARGAEVRLRLADTGTGIPADVRPHIFEPFFTTRPNGAGLGLATARDIVAEARGRIEVEPQEGGGTAFIVSLPRVQAGTEEDDGASLLHAMTFRESQ